MTYTIYRTTQETGEQLRLSAKALANSRSSGKGINLPFVKMANGSVRYRQEDIDQYMESRLVNHTGEVA
jgi:hypothetical protein